MKSLFLILVGETFLLSIFMMGIFCQGVKMWPKDMDKQTGHCPVKNKSCIFQICHFSVSPISIVYRLYRKIPQHPSV